MSSFPPGGFDSSTASAGTHADAHRPADDSEQVYYEGSPLLRGQLGMFIGFSFVALILIVGPGLMHYHWDYFSYSVILLLAVIGIILLFIPALRARTVRYRITNYRIDFERGLLARNIDTMELWHVEDIHFHQSMLNRLMNVGTIVVIGHDETMPRLEMDGLPAPRRLYETLKQRVISVKRQQGVVKMDPG